MNKEILVAGDFYIGPYLNGSAEKVFMDPNNSSPLGDLNERFKNSLLSIVNLEAPIIKSGTKALKTGPALKMKPEVIQGLTKAGIKAVSLANNHIFDYGEEGFKRTLDELESANISFFGAGANKFEAAKPFKVSVPDEGSIGFLNICENEWITSTNSDFTANGLSELEAFYQISDAKKAFDKVVVIFHGGNEYHPLPSPRIKSLFRYFIDCGADLVAGHHTHVVSGFESYKGKMAYYGLGNFLFDAASGKDESWYLGHVLTIQLNAGVLQAELIPTRQSFSSKGKLEVLSGVSKVEHENKLASLNAIIANDTALQGAYENFIIRNKAKYLGYLEPYQGKLNGLYKKGLLPSLISSDQKRLLLNLIRCEAHREVLLSMLTKY